MRAIVSKIDLSTGEEDLASRVDFDNSGVAGAALFHPSGAYSFVALQTSREIAVVDPVGARELFGFKVGRAPAIDSKSVERAFSEKPVSIFSQRALSAQIAEFVVRSSRRAGGFR